MNREINRRAALKPIAALSVAVAIPGLLLACSKKPDCNDTNSLSADDLHTRNDVAKYVDQTLDATKRCSACAQYIAAQPKQCGGCKIVKGPINPDGVCTLFVAKTS
jgi:hypothetical protein